MVRERSRVLGRKCSFSLVEMITESRVDQRSTCRYERNLWKHQENLSLSNSLDIVRANTRPRSRNWNNICGDNIRNPLRYLSRVEVGYITKVSPLHARRSVFIPLDFIMNDRRGVSRRSGWFRKKSQKRRRTGADPVGRKIPVMLRMTLSWWYYFNRRAPNNIFRFQRAICFTVRNASRTILERYLIKANLPLLRVMG